MDTSGTTLLELASEELLGMSNQSALLTHSLTSLKVNSAEIRLQDLDLKIQEESEEKDKKQPKVPSPEHEFQNRREGDLSPQSTSHDETESLIQIQSENPEVDKDESIVENDWLKNYHLIGFRFFIAAYFWFREYSYNPSMDAPSPLGFSGTLHILTFYNINTTSSNDEDANNDRSPIWHSAHIGVPTALFIFLWKVMEAIHATRNQFKNGLCGRSTCKDTIKFCLSIASLIGSQAFLISSIWLIACEQREDAFMCNETFNFPSSVLDDHNSSINDGEVGWYAGLFIMIVANLLESLLGILCCCSGKGEMLRILSPILQAVAFASLVILPEITWLYVAWSGLFFIWEGVILLMISEAPPR